MSKLGEKGGSKKSWMVLAHFPLVQQLSKCCFFTFKKEEVEYQKCLIMICILCKKHLGWLGEPSLKIKKTGKFGENS